VGPAQYRENRTQEMGIKKQRDRAAWGTVSRDQVIEAAVQAVKNGQYEQMTIRSLAASLGVAPMTLYRHVNNKDDLLDEVADRFLGQAWRPGANPEDWRTWVAESARRLRDLLITQPAVLHVYLRHPVASPTAMERMDATLSVLAAGGFDKGSAKRAYASVHTYTVGFAALEASRARWASRSEMKSSGQRQLAAITSPGQFTYGLELLLDGIERQLAAELGDRTAAKGLTGR
jgi:AcrR family transcriptional regulator